MGALPLAIGAAVGSAYVVGTFPTASLVGRAHGRDVEREGSGNPGASNVARLAGARAGAAVFVGDAAKAAVVTVAGLVLDGRPLAMACGAAAVLGHCFPVTRGFRGGKGVACAFGTLVVLYPLVIALALVWLALAKLSRTASIASLVTVALSPVAVALLGRPRWEVLGVAAIAAVVLVRHAGNFARLARGEERSLVRQGGEDV